MAVLSPAYMDAPYGHPVVEISSDYGGNINDYLAQRGELLRQFAIVKIEGPCASACTLMLGLPPGRVCVGAHAKLGFHLASSNSEESAKLADAQFMESYPGKVRAWVQKHGGLQHKVIWASTAETRQLVQNCH
jgi:hypothetical protein